MRSYNIIGIISFLSLGCTSSVTTIQQEQDGGMAGSAGESAGGSAGESFGGSGGEPMNDGGSGSSGASSGGAGGSGDSGGMAGEAGSNSGGAAGMAGADSSGGSGGGECIPKTCLTIAIELSGGDTEAEACGIMDDGCGNLIDCNGCSDDRLECGETIPDSNGNDDSNNPNICGGGCVPLALTGCPPEKEYGYLCSTSNATVHISNACEIHRNNNNSGDDFTWWCCSSPLVNFPWAK